MFFFVPAKKKDQKVKTAYKKWNSFLDMVEAAAEHFPQDIWQPPAGLSAATSTVPSASVTPAPSTSGVSLRAGGYELSVGGTAGSGLYRSNPGEVGASFEIPKIDQVAGGIRDGAGRLWGNVKQRVEERVSRGGTPQGH